MKQHPAIGDDLCSTVRSFESVRPLVRHHHERLDGCGYPDGLAGDRVPLLAQIVSIVDVFDALTTNRPYRRALATSTAYRMMREDARSGWCREDLVETFIDLHRASKIERVDTAPRLRRRLASRAHQTSPSVVRRSDAIDRPTRSIAVSCPHPPTPAGPAALWRAARLDPATVLREG
jgi:HD-GYP domain-containing protein (c-di-GMP phosphodiesterase class II)